MEGQILRIALLALLGTIGGFYLLFPRISRRGLLFGVYVGEDASRSDEARSITNSWYVGMSLWLAASVILALVLDGYYQSVPGSLAAYFLLPVGFLEEYLRAYRRARGLAGGEVTPEAGGV